jgi:hypothetical protein
MRRGKKFEREVAENNKKLKESIKTRTKASSLGKTYLDPAQLQQPLLTATKAK